MFFRKILAVLGATLFFLNATTQTPMNTYDKAWKKIDELINKKGLTQSALEEVNKLYILAKKEKKEAQVIKALLYKMGLQQVKEEDALKKNIIELEKESTQTSEIVKSILASITAELYVNYFEEHRWQLYDRTATVDFNKSDLATWGVDDFHKKISQLYFASLKNEKLLQQTKLEPFDGIINKGNVRHLRPTLFDLLAHRALDYFRNDEQDINKPAYAFELNQPQIFDPAELFITRTFQTNDSLSNQHKALLLYQRILAFHVADKKPDALADADINRLTFSHQYAVLDNKEELYKNALTHITNQYGIHPAAAQAWYLLAQWHYQKASEDKNYDGYTIAKEICDKIVAQKDSSEGKINAQNLLTSIGTKQLTLQTEKVNLPKQPFRMLVNYSNSSEIYIRLITLNSQLKEQLKKVNNWQDEYWPLLLKLPVTKSYSQQLPLTKDYRAHSVEVKIDPMPVGEYLLLASTNKEFTLSKNVLTVQHFHISSIAYLTNGNNFFVVHRESGRPLPRTNVQVWYRVYDYPTQKNIDRKGENLVTDKNGFFTLVPPKTNNNSYYRLEFTNGEDHLFMDDENYNAYNYQETPVDKDVFSTFLFSDRSIYRPGQIVYFKGIVVGRNNKTAESRIIPAQKTTVVLYDVNGQKADSLELTSNEFGSYSGKFTLPQNQLNGSFRLEDNTTHSSIPFLVEEYKRPKFSVEIAKPAGTYKLNDSISITGTAKAYAGNNIDGALVKYRVVRQTRWPIWFDYYRGGKIWPPRGGEEQEIAHGEVKSDAKGEFKVVFNAIPDASIDKKDQPTFYYEVSADVTDINGETRSGSTSVAVAYQALQLSINIPEELASTEFKNLLINSTNLNDIFEKTTVTVTVHKLKQPIRIFRDRYWEQPDQFSINEVEYHTLFPYDIYKDENLESNWPKQEKVFEGIDTTSKTTNYKLQTTNLTPGWYLVEVTAKDKYGEPVKAVKIVQLTGKENTNPAMYGSVQASKTIFEPGEKASYSLKTNLDSIWVIHHLTRADREVEQSLITIDNGTKLFEVPISESDRGGIALDMAFVKHNRVYSNNLNLVVPYTNKELQISYETFRDKTLPGSEEKWKIKISGYKTDKVAAELLTAMYDASLDQFKPHSWGVPGLWNKWANPQIYNGDRGFTQSQSQTKNIAAPQYGYEKIYDQLLSAAGDIQYRQRRRYGRAEVRAMSAPTMNAAGDKLEEGLKKDLTGSVAGVNPSKAKSSLQREEKSDTTRFKNALDKNQQSSSAPIQIRKNFNETAFFIPDLKTDSAGNIEFSFTMPEALTQWKWMTLSHTKALALGYSEKTIITQKELMVQPNAPRFVREGDRMDFTTKVVNLTDKELTGQVELQLIDPTTNQSVDGWFRNFFPNQYFTIPAGQSVPASFTIEIPFQYNKPVTYRLVARSGSISDGEEMMLPVVSNRMLVTESLPLNMRGYGTKQFTFEKLLNTAEGKPGASETLNHQSLTIEFTSNPAWYAVQALPYLMEYPYECAEQTFNRFYANALASYIANASPRIKSVFEKWRTSDTAALLSNLNKNPELKSVLLQETPWVLEANNETRQKKNIALLFDMVRMSREMGTALDKLSAMQSSNGGFVWFMGGPEDRYMTQYILTGIGHLKKLNALPKNNEKLNNIIRKATAYADKKNKEDYDRLVKSKAKLSVQQIGYTEIQYLYMRSFFSETPVPGESFKAYNYFRKQSQQYWIKQSRYIQGMIALSLHRTGDLQTAKDILKSLQQNALVSEEMGMYWKEFNTGGYYWYQSPIESHALLTEAFSEISKNTKITDDLRTWLLKQKQTQNWKTTKATADACYVLLLEGNNWLSNEPVVEISLGGASVVSGKGAGAEGYFKKIIEGPKVNANMGTISVSVTPAPSTDNKSATNTAWGAAYWQYFEELDKIIPSATPLKLVKKLFIEKNTDRGPILQPLKEGGVLHVGDKIKVRIELTVDRNMEYVHMKDMRAAAMEPVNVISQYKWQGGLGYYESTKDASTNFFFGYLPKGTWVFEYSLFVTHTGTFSNGITTIQCMYAPEFTSHSEGLKVTVE